jgi:hypothetical protein
MRAPCSFGASSGRRCRGFGIGRRRAGRRQVRLSFDDDNGHWCHCRRRRGRLLLVHDGEGDVEGSQRLAEEALRQMRRGGMEEEEGLLELDELVHLRHLPHRGLTVRHASHLRFDRASSRPAWMLDDGIWMGVGTSARVNYRLVTRPWRLSTSLYVCSGVRPVQPPILVWPCGCRLWWTRPDQTTTRARGISMATPWMVVELVADEPTTKVKLWLHI